MTAKTKTTALEEERDLLRETLTQTLRALRDLEEELSKTRAEADVHGRTLADRHMLGAMNELLETQLETQKETQRMREDLLGRVVLDDAELIEAQGHHIAEQDQRIKGLDQQIVDQTQKITEQNQRIVELEERVRDIEASTSWKLTAPLRGARRGLR